MKLIFENFKKGLAENMSYFGNAYGEFKQRTDGGEDPLTVADEVLYPLGEGSTRVVFGFPDNEDIVLKVINTKNPELDGGADKYGFTKKHKVVSNENEADFQIQQQYPGIFPKAYERAADYSWIMTERVKPMDHQEMLEHFGLPRLINKRTYKKLAAHMVQMFKDRLSEAVADNEPTFISAPKPSMTPKKKMYGKATLTNILLNNPQSRRVFETAAELGIPAVELTAKNLGTVVRNGKEQVVILDASLWEDK